MHHSRWDDLSQIDFINIPTSFFDCAPSYFTSTVNASLSYCPSSFTYFFTANLCVLFSRSCTSFSNNTLSFGFNEFLTCFFTDFFSCFFGYAFRNRFNSFFFN
jgi:hypothetical protein